MFTYASILYSLEKLFKILVFLYLKNNTIFFFFFFFIPCLAVIVKVCKLLKSSFVISNRNYYVNILVFLSSLLGPVGILIHSCFLSPCSAPHQHTPQWWHWDRYLRSNHSYTTVTISHGRAPKYDVPRHPLALCQQKQALLQCRSKHRHSIWKEGCEELTFFTLRLCNFTYISGPQPDSPMTASCCHQERAKSTATVMAHI